MVLCEKPTVAQTLGFNTTLISAGNLPDATGLWSMHESGGIQSKPRADAPPLHALLALPTALLCRRCKSS